MRMNRRQLIRSSGCVGNGSIFLRYKYTRGGQRRPLDDDNTAFPRVALQLGIG